MSKKRSTMADLDSQAPVRAACLTRTLEILGNSNISPGPVVKRRESHSPHLAERTGRANFNSYRNRSTSLKSSSFP